MGELYGQRLGSDYSNGVIEMVKFIIDNNILPHNQITTNFLARLLLLESDINRNIDAFHGPGLTQLAAIIKKAQAMYQFKTKKI